MRGIVRQLEQGRALEHELAAVGRLRQPEQGALVRVVGQRVVKSSLRSRARLGRRWRTEVATFLRRSELT